MRASSDGWSVTVRALVLPLCLFTERRYDMQPVGIHWISHSNGLSTNCGERVFRRYARHPCARGDARRRAMGTANDGLESAPDAVTPEPRRARRSPIGKLYSWSRRQRIAVTTCR